jgi:phosphoadenosine phosphosulfate reductase
MLINFIGIRYRGAMRSPGSTNEAAAVLAEIAAATSWLEAAHPRDVMRWAHDVTRGDLLVTCSFEDAVLAHVAHDAVPGIEIALLDTQFLFAETWWFAERLTEQLGLNLVVVQPLVTRTDLWQTDVEGCCAVRKVEPLNRVLAGRRGWVTGVRRADGPTRANAPIAAWDSTRHLLKVNPLATWGDDEMRRYEQVHDLPANPLRERGYPSIGCWPCTRPVAPGEDKRAGRWSGSTKTECGLHV